MSEAVSEAVWSGEWVAERLDVRLSGEGLRDLMGLALRRNPKRAHLLVSRVLGKHVPERPGTVRGVGLRLGRDVRTLLGDALADRAVVLGYAETATGLGHCVADGIGGVTYLHSTRSSDNPLRYSTTASCESSTTWAPTRPSSKLRVYPTGQGPGGFMRTVV